MPSVNDGLGMRGVLVEIPPACSLVLHSLQPGNEIAGVKKVMAIKIKVTHIPSGVRGVMRYHSADMRGDFCF